MNGRVDPYLDELEARSIYVIREAFYEYREGLAALWSIGKDSTAMLHLCRKAFCGELPIRVVHIDTGFKFPEIYSFRDRICREWRLRLEICRNEAALRAGTAPEGGRFACCTALKTDALKAGMRRLGMRALLVGIRRDEHAIRAKERYVSLRDDDFRWDYRHQPMEAWLEYHPSCTDSREHARIHPLLHWREIDIWRYLRREKVPVVSLYFSRSGKRYRSIGCACCCQPVPSRAANIDAVIEELQISKIAERSGRSQDKEQEYMMQKLRTLGYM